MRFDPDSKFFHFCARLVCGFALLGLYDIKVLKRVFAPLREGGQDPE